MINLSESDVLLVHASLVPVVDDLASQLPSLKRIFVAGGEVPSSVAGISAAPWESLLSDDDRDPDVAISAMDIASIMFTSGTTGVSKGCMLSHRYGTYMGTRVGVVLMLPSGDCIYTPYPLYHMTAAYAEVLPAMIAGCRLVVRQRFSASRFWDEVRDVGATIFTLMGSVPRILENAPTSPTDI